MENHYLRPWVGTRVLLTARSGPRLPGCYLAHTPMTEAITTLASGTPFSHKLRAAEAIRIILPSLITDGTVHLLKLSWVPSPPDPRHCRDPGGWQCLTALLVAPHGTSVSFSDLLLNGLILAQGNKCSLEFVIHKNLK